eukprot:TRINITY_DN11553_c0_g1_i1.p1 TRINITY_DN11553_c0_g1~~TRINITY_DN11553_c0_g1_i1.p1  ORF type:complete len:213 (-),score=23.75 TRINITY_DN11553_c0_g1_i1:61-699(-)
MESVESLLKSAQDEDGPVEGSAPRTIRSNTPRFVASRSAEPVPASIEYSTGALEHGVLDDEEEAFQSEDDSYSENSTRKFQRRPFSSTAQSKSRTSRKRKAGSHRSDSEELAAEDVAALSELFPQVHRSYSNLPCPSSSLLSVFPLALPCDCKGNVYVPSRLLAAFQVSNSHKIAISPDVQVYRVDQSTKHLSVIPSPPPEGSPSGPVYFLY